MPHDPPAHSDADARSAPRSNMYIVAVLSWAQSSSPAKIRNMSPSGALIEAATVPPEGAVVGLARGLLRAEGSIAWVSDGRCGIQFNAPVPVLEWMAPTKNGEQRRIDETFAVLKAGALPLREARRARADESLPIPQQLAGDLGELSRLLEALGAELAGDRDVVRKYGGRLQTFDLAAQTLSVAIDLLANSSHSPADAAARLRSLRASRSQSV